MPANEQKNKEQKKLPGIFISYRRSDTPDAVGRIYDRLIAEFGKARVFKDVDSIPLGQDFRGHLNDIVGGCAAVLAIVGPRWSDTRNSAGQRRLEDPEDFVRIELEAALAREVPVVPVLVGHAPMPGSAELPASLAAMVYRQSIEVRPDPDFHNDATRLVAALWAIVDPTASQVRPTSGRPRRSWLLWLSALAITTTLAAIAFAVPALKHLHETPPPETRTEISAHSQSVDAGAIALSPDGKQIVFVETNNGVSRLWLRALSATAAQPLPGTEGGIAPFWSPDSRSIGFFTIDALKRLDVGGGAPLTLAPVTIGMGGSWNADGVILFSQAGKGLARIAATGGEVTQVGRTEQGALNPNPVFLPDGRRYLYLTIGNKAPGVYLGSLEGAAPVRLTPIYGNFAYLPSGWLLTWDNVQRVLIAQRLDAEKGVIVGAPVTIAEGGGSVATSATGLVAYWSGVVGGGMRQLLWRSRTGADLGSVGEPDQTYSSPRVSPEGRRVAVVRGVIGNNDIWVLEGERTSRLTFGSGGRDYPVWSPDGLRIAFGSGSIAARGLFQKSSDGAGGEESLLKVDLGAAPTSWSADGRHLMYVYLDPGTLLDVGILPMTGNSKPWTILNSPFFETSGEFSPDGKWVAYESNESGRAEIYIRPFDAADAEGATPAHLGKWQVSTTGGVTPKWNPNGMELFFLNPAGDMMAAPISFAGSAPTPGTPVKLFQTGILGGGQDQTLGPQYDVARDGRFLINTLLNPGASVSSPIILIQNWNPDAKQ